MKQDAVASSAKILFVGCLYKSARKSEQFQSYAAGCVKTILALRALFPSSDFLLHTDESLDADEISKFAGITRIVIHKYPILLRDFGFPMQSSAIMRRKNSDQLTKCMRLTTLFSNEWQGKFNYCIVLDIHDNVYKTAELIQRYLAGMTPKQIYFLTNWHSTEADCPYDPTITRATHTHFDAGFVLVKKPLPSRADFSFEEYCIARIMRSPARLVKGPEEMLIDEYLKSLNFYATHRAQIVMREHACKIDPGFYATTQPTLTLGYDQRRAKRKRAEVIQHCAHSAKTNARLEPVQDIYVCTQMPTNKAKRRRQS